MKKRILITGANGFIGRHLCSFLNLNEECELHYLGRINWEDEDSLKRTLEKIKPNFLIHLAAYAEPGRKLEDFSKQVFNTILPSIQLARFLPTNELEMTLFVGSCEEYADGKVPFRESDSSKVMSPYGWGKISSKLAVEWICKSRKLPFCWLRPFLTFGPGQTGSPFIPTVIRACVNNEELRLTHGAQTRDFVYVKDLLKMMHKIIQQPQRADGLTLNLCSGTPRTIRSVAETIQSLVGRGRLLWGELPYRENEAMNFYGDPSLFNEIYGGIIYTPFEDALKATLAARQDLPGAAMNITP